MRIYKKIKTKNVRGFSIFKKVISQIMILALLMVSVPLKSVFAADIVFTDGNFQDCVEMALGKNPGDPIRDTEVAGLTSLSCFSMGISDVSELTYFTGLNELNFFDNNLSSINLSANSSLLSMNLYSNTFSSIEVDNVIATIDGFGTSSGSLYLEGGSNEARTIATDDEYNNLITRGWDVTVGAPSGGGSGEVTFSDAALQACVETALAKNPGDPISSSEAAGLTSLNCTAPFDGPYIYDLTGLEYFTGLEELGLHGNEIVDVSPLSELTGIRSLSLGANNIEDISSLDSLTSLEWLYLAANDLLSDISVVVNFTNLQTIELNATLVSDIFVLLPLSFLTNVSLWNVPLSYQGYLDALTLDAREGVTVTYNTYYSYWITTNTYCSDGIITSPETCDDGNQANGDGCSDSCAIEQVVAPSSCSEISKDIDSISIGWIDNSDNETGFEVQASVNATNYSVIDDGILPNVISYQLSGLTSATKYWIRIRSLGSEGDSSWLLCDPIRTYGPPDTPSLLDAVEMKANSIAVIWQDNAEYEDHFVLEMSLDGVDYEEVDGAIPSSWRGYGVNGLEPSTQYWFRVKAENTYGSSEYSTYGPVTTATSDGEFEINRLDSKWHEELRESQSDSIIGGIVADSLGNIYTSEYNGIVKRDANGNFVTYFNTGISWTESLKIYDDYLYITGVGGVTIYDLTGNYVGDVVTDYGYYTGIVRDYLGNFYVSSNYPAGPTVKKFDSSYILDTLFESNFESEYLSSAHDIDIDSNGVLYVTDTYNYSGIPTFDQSGTYLGDFTTGGGGAYGVFIDVEDNLYVTRGNTTGQVDKYNSFGVLDFSIYPGEVSIRDVYADSDYVYLGGYYYMNRYDLEGNLVDEYPREYVDGQFFSGQDIDIDSNGVLYVADSYITGLNKFNQSGTYLGQIDFGFWGSGVQGLFIDDNDDFYVTNSSVGSVYKYDEEGNELLNIYIGGPSIYDLYTDATYIYMGGYYKVDKYDLSGNFVDSLSSLSDVVYGIAGDADGNIYYSQGTTIYKMDSDFNAITSWPIEGISADVRGMSIKDNYLYVSTLYDIWQYDLNGNLISNTSSPQYDQFSGVEVNDDGNIFGVTSDAVYKYVGVAAEGAVCGDGLLEEVEECDDGNVASGDGCSDVCEIEVMADSIVAILLNDTLNKEIILNTTFAAPCYNNVFSTFSNWTLWTGGSTYHPYGISASCESTNPNIRINFFESNPVQKGDLVAVDMGDYSLYSPIVAVCGDGILEDAEECDDGNNMSDDGCDFACGTEGSGHYLGLDFSLVTSDYHELTLNLTQDEWSGNPILMLFGYGDSIEVDAEAYDGYVMVNSSGLYTAYIPHVEGETNISMMVVSWSEGHGIEEDPDLYWVFDNVANILGTGPTVFDLDISNEETCASFTYSDWGACSGGVKTRTVLTSLPEGCTGGSPVLTDTCTSGGGGSSGSTTTTPDPVTPTPTPTPIEPITVPPTPVITPVIPVTNPVVIVEDPAEEEVVVEEKVIEDLISEQENVYEIQDIFSLFDVSVTEDYVDVENLFERMDESQNEVIVDLNLIDSRKVYSDDNYQRVTLALVANYAGDCNNENTINCLGKVYGLQEIEKTLIADGDKDGLSDKERGDAIVFQKLPGEKIETPRITNLGGTTGSSPAILALAKENDRLLIDISAEIEKNGEVQYVDVMTVEGVADEEGKVVVNMTNSLLNGKYVAKIRAIRGDEQIFGNEKSFIVEGSIDEEFYLSDLKVEEEILDQYLESEIGGFIKDLLSNIEAFESNFKTDKYIAYLREERRRYVVTGKVNKSDDGNNDVVYLAYQSVTFGSAVIADASQGGVFRTVVSKELPKDLHTLNAYAYNPKKDKSTSLKKITFNTK